MVPRGIVLHLTASRFGDAAQIDQWHKAQGWSGIGYHRVIMNGIRNSGDTYNPTLDGAIQRGRADNVMGAHCKGEGMNRCTLGISCVGMPGAVPAGAQVAPANMTTAPYLTANQFRAVVNAAARLCMRYGIDPGGTFVHPTTGKVHPVISQHSQHEPAKPSCASLQINNVRQAIVAEVARLAEEMPLSVEFGSEEEMATEAPDADAMEAMLPEYLGMGSFEGPEDLDSDVPPQNKKD